MCWQFQRRRRLEMLTRLHTQYRATCIMRKERERCSNLDQELVATQLLCKKKKARVGLAEDVLHRGKSRQFQHQETCVAPENTGSFNTKEMCCTRWNWQLQHQEMCCARWNWQLQHQEDVLHQRILAASTPKKCVAPD